MDRLVILNMTAEVEEGDWDDDCGYVDFVVVKINGHEVARSLPTDYFGRGEEAIAELAATVIARLLGGSNGS